MKKFVIILIIVLMGSVQSCTEYLNETNPNTLSTDTYWKTLDESESNLTSVYAAMLDSYVLDLEREPYREDIATSSTTQWLPWYEQRILFDNDDLGRRWESKYRVIWRANQVIEGLNSMTDVLKADPRWKLQMGQARFFRGLMHFYLHSEFNNGKIIIRDKVPTTTAEYSKNVSTSQEVMDFFRADLEYAYANLPAQMEPRTRADGGAAATILGTSYLYEGNYLKAKDYFNDIINNVKGNYGYALLKDQDVYKMYTGLSDYNSESILEINYANNAQTENGFFNEESFLHRLARWSGPLGPNQVTKETFGGQSQLIPAAWLTWEYMKEPMDTKDLRNRIGGVSTGAMKTVPLRASQSIAIVSDEVSPYYGYKAPQVYTFPGAAGKYALFKKYTAHALPGITTESQIGTTGWKSNRNIIVNRLAGVYLMQAECLAKTGNYSGAVDLINKIRARWGLKLLGPTSTALNDYDGVTYNDETTIMNQLMYKEYPLELAFEGFNIRFNDLRRWKISAKRFSDLSLESYGLADYTFKATTVAPIAPGGTRKTSLLVKGGTTSPFTEYGRAAAAWAAQDLSYFPLPQNETLNNSGLTK